MAGTWGKFGEDEGGLEGEGTPSERGSLLPPRSCYAPCKKESLPPETKNLAEPDFIPTYRKPHRETQRNAYPDMHCE